MNITKILVGVIGIPFFLWVIYYGCKRLLIRWPEGIRRIKEGMTGRPTE